VRAVVARLDAKIPAGEVDAAILAVLSTPATATTQRKNHP